MAAEERDSPTTDPNPGSVTQGAGQAAAADQTPSVIRPVETKASGASSDTLLSVQQATREDLALDERLSTAERNLSELMLRVERLERRPEESPAEAPQVRWLWLVFLAGLALAWQILSRLQ